MKLKCKKLKKEKMLNRFKQFLIHINFDVFGTECNENTMTRLYINSPGLP